MSWITWKCIQIHYLSTNFKIWVVINITDTWSREFGKHISKIGKKKKQHTQPMFWQKLILWARWVSWPLARKWDTRYTLNNYNYYPARYNIRTFKRTRKNKYRSLISSQRWMRWEVIHFEKFFCLSLKSIRMDEILKFIMTVQ